MDPLDIVLKTLTVLGKIVGRHATRTTRDGLLTTEYKILRMVYDLG